MRNESHRPLLTVRSPVDASMVRLLRVLDPIAELADCAYFVGGATARDLLLVHVYGLVSGRATRDIDFGIAVASWEQFAKLKERLAESGYFRPDRRAMQRLIYTERDAGFSVPVDFVPFRGVEDGDGTIAWPPERDIVLNVAGFEEALHSAVDMRIEEDVTVCVASLPGLTLLKLFAWFDRRVMTNKDAVDLEKLMSNYASAGNTDRLFEEEMELLESADFDLDIAGAELLGRDVVKICSAEARVQIRALMTPETEVERLVQQGGEAVEWRGKHGEVGADGERL